MSTLCDSSYPLQCIAKENNDLAFNRPRVKIDLEQNNVFLIDNWKAENRKNTFVMIEEYWYCLCCVKLFMI
jgi:hypothetical protein